MSQLAEKQCVPCRGGVPPLPKEEQERLLAELRDWKIINGHQLYKEYRFTNYSTALEWVNAISTIAEDQGHHPDISFGWGYVHVKVWTHKIDNLTESDFVFAAKLDAASVS